MGSTRKLWFAVKESLSEAQNHRCAYCGKRTNECIGNHNKDDQATLDHVIPLSKGGADHPDNLVLACHGCDNKKGAMTGWRFAMILGHMPRDDDLLRT